jgi:5'-3' exonuclease
VKVHLVDGTFELFRAYFGAPSARSPSGQEVGATRGLLRSMLSLLREREVTHVACAFDTVIESFRNQLFEGYKRGDGLEPALWEQFPLAERGCAALGLTVWGMREFEADDALAAGARRYGAEPGVEQVVLCSPDKDLAQCVDGDRVVTVDRVRRTRRDEAGVWKRFGVGPASIPDYLALVGDAADGIPGIPGWGAKSTAAVLAHYTHLEAVPDDPEAWAVTVRGARRLAANLAEGREAAALYKRLATLRTDVPLEQGLDELRWRGADRPALEAFCEEIGDARLIDSVPTFLAAGEEPAPF